MGANARRRSWSPRVLVVQSEGGTQIGSLVEVAAQQFQVMVLVPFMVVTAADGVELIEIVRAKLNAADVLAMAYADADIDASVERGMAQGLARIRASEASDG